LTAGAADPGRPGPAAARAAFPDRLAELVEARKSQVVLGLDPDPAQLWPDVSAAAAPGRVEAAASARGTGAPPGDAAAALGGEAAAAMTGAAVALHCEQVIDAAGPACVAVKLQLACFERLGHAGWAVLSRTVAHARSRGLLVIADGKRGDVPVTARAYAQGLVGETPGPFGAIPGLGVDAFTANPLLGRDALEPLVDAAVEHGAGCFVLVRTSNPGAADLQNLPAPEAPLHEALAAIVHDLGAPSIASSGLSSVGAVVGATRPEPLARLRELMPHAIFLLPGVGAQGGTAGDLGAAFSPHPAAGLVAASRSIADAHLTRGGDPPGAAAAAAEELRAAAWRAAQRQT